MDRFENRQLSRRGFLRASGLTMTGALLAACTVPQGATAPSAGGAPAAEPVTIRYWLPPTTEQAYREEKFNEFMEMHPDIVIDMDGADPANYNEATQLLFRQDDAPDVFWKYNLNLPQMLEADIVQPYPQVVQEYLRQAYPAAMFLEGINTWEGEIYGFWPVGAKTATRVLYCSDDKLAEIGADPPQHGVNYAKYPKRWPRLAPVSLLGSPWAVSLPGTTRRWWVRWP